MDVVDGLERLTRHHGRLFVVVGVFDGIHRGHAYLLRRLVTEARRRDARPAVITFDAHPDEILTGSAPPLLVDPDERLARLAGAGVGVTVVQHFDRALRETPYEGFVRMITDRTELSGFLMTPDAAFGYERGGTPGSLAALGARSAPAFDVAVVAPYALDGTAVRSSDIRAAIAAGDLATARRLLGRAHGVIGLAGPSSNGVRLRFPMPVALPPDGHYVVRAARLRDPRASSGAPAVASVENPTVDVDRSIRGERIRVLFTGERLGRGRSVA